MQLNNSRSEIDHLAHIMPGRKPAESIVSYAIRLRREREAQAERVRRLWICGGSILAMPIAMLAGVAIAELLFRVL